MFRYLNSVEQINHCSMHKIYLYPMLEATTQENPVTAVENDEYAIAFLSH